MKLRVGPYYLFSMMWWSLLSNLVAIEDFLRKIQRIPWCRDGARTIRAPVVSDIPVAYVRYFAACGGVFSSSTKPAGRRASVRAQDKKDKLQRLARSQNPARGA